MQSKCYKRRDRALILTYLDSPMADVFPHCWLYFFDFSHLQWKMGRQSRTKRSNFGSVSFSGKLKSFKVFLLFARVLPLVRILAILDHICGSKCPKTSKQGLNAILMKLISIIFLHESVNRKLLRARNSVFWRNAYGFLGYIEYRHKFHALPFVESLVNFLYKFHRKSPKIGLK